jgi:hypothetical protein
MFDWRDYEIRAQRYKNLFRKRATNIKEQDMDTRMVKNVKAMGEAEYTRIVGDYAKRLHPELTRERAFAKIFIEDSDEGRAIRKMWQVSKEGDLESDGRDDAPTVEDDEDAMEELERLAEQQRRRENGMSKAAAFTKVYTDPANAKLAQRERMQNRPR